MKLLRNLMLALFCAGLALAPLTMESHPAEARAGWTSRGYSSMGSMGSHTYNYNGGSAINVSLGEFSSGLGAFAWTVPGVLLGLPGLLVLLILGLQMTGAAMFVPVTRRILGNSDRQPGRRPRRHR